MQFSKIGKKIHVLVIALFILPAIPMAANALPAFPGAQGFGSDTVGGRYAGVKLYKVNTLAEGTSGSCNGNICTGTLRYALTASGPRIVIFTVGGTITLNSGIVIHPESSYLTIAGQTAPGGGILIKGPNIDGNPSITIRGAHDIIMRALRIREDAENTIEILGYPVPTYNVILDHNSFSWSADTVVGAGYAVHDYTLSWNIFSEGSDGPANHGSLLLLSGSQGCDRLTYNGSVHHNLFAHTGTIDRAPTNKHDTDSHEIINNLIYNWYWMAITTMSPAYIAKNHYIKGANTLDGGSNTCNAIRVSSDGQCPQLPDASVVVTHNIGPCRTTDKGDDWLIVVGGTNQHRTNTPTFTLSGVTEDDVTDVHDLVLNGAGAIVPYRDSVDNRVVNSVRNLTGKFIKWPSDVGGWPTIASGSYPTDTDDDGIPDAWETAHGLNPNISSDALAYAPSGYLWIEEYINSFFPAIGSSLPTRALIPNPPSIIGIN